MKADSKKGLDYWVTHLNRTELPALAHTIAEINRLCESDESSATELADLILKDAALTSRVLQVANSVHYNPNIKKPIVTITRAVILLGFSGLKSILIMTMLVEHVLKKGGKARMLRCLARAVHAATQARYLINHVAEDDQELFEEVFVAALVYHVAELAFWGSNQPAAKELDKRLGEGQLSDPALEKELLGTTFKSISSGLVKQWQLGSEFMAFFSDKESDSPKVQAVMLADEVCVAVEQGWDSIAAEQSIQKAATFIGLRAQDTKVLLKDRSDCAIDIASRYGADEICRLIPSSRREAKIIAEPAPPSKPGDPALQLQILREMHSLTSQNLDINAFFQMLMEAIHRGIGIDRVGVFVIDKTASWAKLKYAVSRIDRVWQKGTQLAVAEQNESIFSYVVQQKRDVWLNGEQQVWPVGDQSSLSDKLNIESAVLAGVFAGTKPVALIVADGERDIEAFQYESFCHFVQQASQALSGVVKQ
jgi:HD-like signal output (HDOD) protein